MVENVRLHYKSPIYAIAFFTIINKQQYNAVTRRSRRIMRNVQLIPHFENIRGHGRQLLFYCQYWPIYYAFLSNRKNMQVRQRINNLGDYINSIGFGHDNVNNNPLLCPYSLRIMVPTTRTAFSPTTILVTLRYFKSSLLHYQFRQRCWDRKLQCIQNAAACLTPSDKNFDQNTCIPIFINLH